MFQDSQVMLSCHGVENHRPVKQRTGLIVYLAMNHFCQGMPPMSFGALLPLWPAESAALGRGELLFLLQSFPPQDRLTHTHPDFLLPVWAFPRVLSQLRLLYENPSRLDGLNNRHFFLLIVGAGKVQNQGGSRSGPGENPLPSSTRSPFSLCPQTRETKGALVTFFLLRTVIPSWGPTSNYQHTGS